MTESTLITYEHLLCKLGGEELDQNNLRELRIEKRINDHVRIYLTGVVGSDRKDQYLEMTEADTEITVTSGKAGKETVLFNGVVTNIGIKSVRDIYYFEIEGASHTYNLDIAKEYRSFQDYQMSFRDLIEAVLGNAPALCNKVAVKDEALGQFILQYRETKWEFLKRRASQPPFHTGLVADATGKKAQFWFGIPEGVERNLNGQGFHYNARKKMAAYRDTAANHHNGTDEGDFVEYELVTDEFYNIGDTVSFKGQKLRVGRATATMSEGILKFDCALTTEAGLKQNLLYNQQLTGISIEGKVIAVERDNLKVSLVGIGEKEQAEATACWFPYATPYTAEGNTGWYCMPEIGDYVRLFCPNYQEAEAFITTSVRFRERDANGQTSSYTDNGDKISNPQIKYFRTNFGKEIMFSEDEIVITGKDGELLVRLNEAKGIEILSHQAVTLTAKNDVNINSEEGKVALSAATELDLICQASSIKLDGETNIKGSQVKIN
jgi:phage baseplate assembly protein gpV